MAAVADESAMDVLDLDLVTIDIEDDEAPAAPPASSGQAVSSSAPSKRSGKASEKVVILKDREFLVRIDKLPKQTLGLDIDKADGKTMLVMNVKAGPVADFNDSSEGEKVRKGDRIVSMNGVSGNVVQMLQSLADCCMVVCKLKRVTDFSMQIIKTSPSEKLGIDVDYESAVFLRILSLSKLSKGDHVLASGSTLMDRNPPIKPQTPGIVTRVKEEPRTNKMETKASQEVAVRFKDERTEVDVHSSCLQKLQSSFGPIERFNLKVGPELALQVGDLILEAENAAASPQEPKANLSASKNKAHGMLKTIAELQRLTFLVQRRDEGGVDCPSTRDRNETKEDNPMTEP